MTLRTTPQIAPPQGGRRPMHGQPAPLDLAPGPSPDIAPSAIPLRNITREEPTAEELEAAAVLAATVGAAETPPPAATGRTPRGAQTVAAAASAPVTTVQQTSPTATPRRATMPAVPAERPALTTEQVGIFGARYCKGDDIVDIAAQLDVPMAVLEEWITKYPAMTARRNDAIAARQASVAAHTQGAAGESNQAQFGWSADAPQPTATQIETIEDDATDAEALAAQGDGQDAAASQPAQAPEKIAHPAAGETLIHGIPYKQWMGMSLPDRDAHIASITATPEQAAGVREQAERDQEAFTLLARGEDPAIIMARTGVPMQRMNELYNELVRQRESNGLPARPEPEQAEQPVEKPKRGRRTKAEMEAARAAEAAAKAPEPTEKIALPESEAGRIAQVNPTAENLAALEHIVAPLDDQTIADAMYVADRAAAHGRPVPPIAQSVLDAARARRRAIVATADAPPPLAPTVPQLARAFMDIGAYCAEEQITPADLSIALDTVREVCRRTGLTLDVLAGALLSAEGA